MKLPVMKCFYYEILQYIIPSNNRERFLTVPVKTFTVFS